MARNMGGDFTWDLIFVIYELVYNKSSKILLNSIFHYFLLT
jgi:hypothetical protein